MELRATSLTNLHQPKRESYSSSDDAPLNLTLRETNKYRLSKLKLHRSCSQYSVAYPSPSPPTPEPKSLSNSPRILSRESSAESLFEYGISAVSLSCPVTPTKERRPFSDDFRRAIAAKRRAEEESKFEHPKRHPMPPLRTEILRRSTSVSYGFHMQGEEAREDGIIRVYERTTSLVQDAQSDSSLTLSNLDIWNSLSSQSVATDFQGDKEMESESSPSPIQKDIVPPEDFNFQSSEEMPPKEGYLKPLKVKLNHCYKVVKHGEIETDVVPPSAADKKNCPNNLSPLRIRSLLTAEEKHQERRKRNNESAKKSRKNRRKREMDMMEQVTSLQEENRRLKLQLDKTQKELEICKQKERSSWSDSVP